MPIQLPDADDCLFCERLLGTYDDWAVIESSDATVSFVNPRQFEIGQCLIIPRRHAPTLVDLSVEEAQAVMATVHRVARAVVEAYDPDGLTVYQNNGIASYQHVPHCHFHVVPRRFGSGWGEGPRHLAALDRGALERDTKRLGAPMDTQHALADEIRRHLSPK